jgi:hypothetical protein
MQLLYQLSNHFGAIHPATLKQSHCACCR